ncbi:MAG: ABC transporter ATP-binding protein [Candidatus Omnitrophota bacterium]
MKNCDNILKVEGLTVSLGGRRVIDGVGFGLRHGAVTALVGESGSGKTLTSLAILDLLPAKAVKESGHISFRGKDVFGLGPSEKREMRGKDIAMVFQEPFTALNPVMRAGVQIAEAMIAHRICRRQEADGRVGKLLDMVKLPAETARRYPHELSGGMRQRVVLAMALSCGPEVLILDEPTTALDVSVQKEILDLIMRIQKERRLAVLFVTHDFSVVNMIADEVCVMRNGAIVEQGKKEQVLRSPVNPYTKHLIDCVPRLGDKRRRLPGGM